MKACVQELAFFSQAKACSAAAHFRISMHDTPQCFFTAPLSAVLPTADARTAHSLVARNVAGVHEQTAQCDNELSSALLAMQNRWGSKATVELSVFQWTQGVATFHHNFVDAPSCTHRTAWRHSPHSRCAHSTRVVFDRRNHHHQHLSGT